MLKIIGDHVVNISEIAAVKRVNFDTEVHLKSGGVVVLCLNNVDHEVLLDHVREQNLMWQKARRDKWLHRP